MRSKRASLPAKAASKPITQSGELAPSQPDSPPGAAQTSGRCPPRHWRRLCPASSASWRGARHHHRPFHRRPPFPLGLSSSPIGWPSHPRPRPPVTLAAMGARPRSRLSFPGLTARSGRNRTPRKCLDFPLLRRSAGPCRSPQTPRACRRRSGRVTPSPSPTSCWSALSLAARPCSAPPRGPAICSMSPVPLERSANGLRSARQINPTGSRVSTGKPEKILSPASPKDPQRPSRPARPAPRYPEPHASPRASGSGSAISPLPQSTSATASPPTSLHLCEESRVATEINAALLPIHPAATSPTHSTVEKTTNSSSPPPRRPAFRTPSPASPSRASAAFFAPAKTDRPSPSARLKVSKPWNLKAGNISLKLSSCLPQSHQRFPVGRRHSRSIINCHDRQRISSASPPTPCGSIPLRSPRAMNEIFWIDVQPSIPLAVVLCPRPPTIEPGQPHRAEKGRHSDHRLPA